MTRPVTLQPWLALLLSLVLSLWTFAAIAKIEVEVTGVEDDIRNNVLIFLSLQRYRDAADLAPETVERLHERAEREVRQALRPFGFYSPKIEAKLTRAPNGRDWRVDLHIDPGPPVIVREVNVKIVGPGEERRSLQRIVRESPLREGERLNHGAYDKLKGDLQRRAVSIGYLDAAFQASDLQVDLQDLTAKVNLVLTTGQRYRFGATEIEQDAVDPQLVQRFLRYREGDYFNASDLLRTQFVLDDSLYFSEVEVLPGTRDKENLTVPVTIRAQTGRKNTYSIGAGYTTNTHARGTLGWDNRRVNRAGHRAHVQITGAQEEQSFKSRYLIPVGDPALEKLSFDGIVSNQELSDLNVRSIEFIPALTQVHGRWQRVLSVTATREVTETVVDDNTSPSTSDVLLIPGISFARLPRNYSGDLLAFKPGLYAELSGSHSAFGSSSDFLRLHVQDEHLFDLAPKWHLLLRGEIGLSAVGDFSELPGSQRFFAGGDKSVRGFGLNELSPVQREPVLDAKGNQEVDIKGNLVFKDVKTGGRHLLVGSIELIRDLPRNFGIAVFFDTGNAVNKLGDPLEYSVGLGIRWRLPVLTVGIDVAQPLSQPGAGPRLHLNISPQF